MTSALERTICPSFVLNVGGNLSLKLFVLTEGDTFSG